MLSSGEWSSGKRWADDAPKEQVEADSVSIISTGSCGANVHGLEDEFLGEFCIILFYTRGDDVVNGTNF